MTTITVRYGYSTYTATAQGKRASCTASPEGAARALAGKLYTDQRINLHRVSADTTGSGHFVFEATPEAAA